MDCFENKFAGPCDTNIDKEKKENLFYENLQVDSNTLRFHTSNLCTAISALQSNTTESQWCIYHSAR